MSEKAPVVPDTRKEKRQHFLQPRKTRWVVPAGLAALAALVGVSAFFFFRPRGSEDRGPTAPVPAVTASAAEGEIRIPLSDLGGGHAKFYDHAAVGGKRVRMFAIRDTDGTYRAALDACEVCYHAGKGYAQRGGEMVCRQCGNSYAPVLIDRSPGGCHPIRLERRVEGEHLVISAADVEATDAKAAAQAADPRRRMRRPM